MENEELEKIDNEKQESAKKIVPAYMKNKEENTNNTKDKSKKQKNKTTKSKRKINKKKLLIIISIIILLIALSICIFIFSQNKKYAKYEQYEETMYTYAFDIMYDNGTAATREKVTKSEAIKMAIACTKNITTLPGYDTENQSYSNEIWVKYAVANGIIMDSEINELNANDPATYIEIISYLEKSKVKLLNSELKTSVEIQFKDIENYTTEEQTYLQDLIENGVIENSKTKLNGDRKVFKGEVNEIITKFAEKNNTITLKGDKININPEKIPSNANEYTYILSNVDKEVYEKEFQKGEYTDYVLNPKESYIKNKEYYADMKEMVEQYYNTILNVDYNTITADKFYEDINLFIKSPVKIEQVNEYIDYVKSNKINISGTAKVQMPIIYYDGVDYRVRTKLEFNINESNTDKNVLFNDLSSDEDITYTNKENELIIDAKLGIFMYSSGVKIRNVVISDIVL